MAMMSIKKGLAVKSKPKSKKDRKTTVPDEADAAAGAAKKLSRSAEMNHSDEKRGKPQKTTLDQTDAGEIGQNDQKSLMLRDIEKITKKHGFSLESDNKGKRIYRKRQELPEPELDPKASANRLARQLSPRLYPEHIELFNECARSFPNKREALERAIELLADELGLHKK